MKSTLSPIFGNNLSTYLNASSEQLIYACLLTETHQAIDQLPRRHQITVRRTASECALSELADQSNLKVSLKIIQLFFFACIYSIFFCSSQVKAETVSLNITKQIDYLKSAKEVTVFISSRPFEGAVNIESSKFNQCRFIAKDVKNIERLVENLKQSKIKKHSSDELYLPIIGLIIEASFKDKSKMIFAFGREYFNEGICRCRANIAFN